MNRGRLDASQAAPKYIPLILNCAGPVPAVPVT
jgi:hypothetical protein